MDSIRNRRVSLINGGKMQVTIEIPTLDEITSNAIVLGVAHPGEPWSRTQLRDDAKKRGVYVHLSGQRILYIGKTTTGNYGTYGERFRREFQQKASKNSPLYQLLSRQRKPIRTYLLDLSKLNKMITVYGSKLTNTRKALIMEQTLIGLFEPLGNRT